MRSYVVFLVLVFLWVCPAQVLAADFEWTLNWQNGQLLTETVVSSDPDLVSPEGGWEKTAPNTFSRQTEGWAAYNQLSDKLPIVAKTKDYLAVKVTKITLDSAAYQEGTTFYELTRDGSGQIKIEVPGLIMKAQPAIKSQWSQGFTATWNTGPQAQSEEYRFDMIAITIEILPSIISLLVIGWGIIWMVYRRQVKRMERLIDARYSLDKVVPVEIPNMEQIEAAPSDNDEKTKNI